MKKSAPEPDHMVRKLVIMLVAIGIFVAGLVYYHSIQENPYTSEVFFTSL